LSTDPGRLAVSVTHADGSVTRWGFDENDAGDVPGDLTFTTNMPGGFASMSCSLLREIQPRADESLFDSVKVYGPGSKTVWEGRIAQMPRQGGRSATVNPGAIGWSAHLEDDQSFVEVYVDRDPNSWSAAPIARKLVAVIAGEADDTRITGSVTPEGLYWSTEGGINSNYLLTGQMKELWYLAPPGTRVSSMEYVGTTGFGFSTVFGGQPMYEAPTLFGTDDYSVGGGYVSNGLTYDGTLHGASLPTSKRFCMIRVKFSNTGTTIRPNATSYLTLNSVAVYGDHGVAASGVIGGNPDGYYASDVVANIVSRAAPLLNFTTGTAGTIQPSTFVIPHLVFPTPTTAADAIQQTNAYHAWNWAVWDDRTFYYSPPDTGIQWQARIADGAQLSLEGDTAEQIINGVVVSYQDGGIAKTAGPPGSDCTVTDASLQDTASNNPVNSHSIPRRWKTLNISFPTTDAGAIELGAIYLAESLLATRKGSITLQGQVRHPDGMYRPVSHVRAGDSILITDRAGDVSRRIISTSYSHATRTASLDCGFSNEKLNALLERLTVATNRIA
jgi:hypothetical protein